MKQGYRITLFALGVLGIVLQVLNDGFGMFMYYTILSNLLVVGFLFYLLLQKGELTDRQLRVKGGVVMAIIITCVVYHILLAPTAAAKDYYNIENFICHYILPLGMLLDTLLFDRFSYRRLDPVLWCGVPLAYFLFAMTNGVLFHIPIPGREVFYPYFFVNVKAYGLGPVLGYCVVILAAYIAVGYVLYGALAILRRQRNKVL